MRAFLVLGPESSGTRLLTRLLIAAGCEGSAAHHQPFDEQTPEGVSPLVWRRSVPQRGHWPDIASMVGELRRRNYSVHAIVTMRDWLPSAGSQVRAGHVADRVQAYTHLARAYPHIFAELGRAGVPFVCVTYAGLVGRPDKMLGWLTAYLSLPTPNGFEDVFDADERWWEKWPVPA